MDGIDNHFLSRARFPEEEHRVVEGRHLPDHLHHIPQARISSDYLVICPGEELVFQESVIVEENVPVFQHCLMSQRIGQGDGEDPGSSCQVLIPIEWI